jgi:two-component system sensor histidine kinase KdpD
MAAAGRCGGQRVRACQRTLQGHALQLQLADDLPVLEYDAVLIERVLVNLLENAAKYTPPGSQITLKADTQGATIRVCVQDDGPGLPSGLEQKLFDKFSRGNSESTTPGVGWAWPSAAALSKPMAAA